MSKKVKIQLAREFRKNPTRSEKIMWNALRSRQFLNLKFRRQYLQDGYLIDFYCHKLKLAIEIDGSVHLEKEQAMYDKERQKIIEQSNVRFIRINSAAVEININKILKKLEIIIDKIKVLK